MKTKMNFQKTAMRSAAVIVSFVLISYTVSAQEYWKKLLINSSLNEIAIALVEKSNKELQKNSNTELTSNAYYDNAFDPALELEDWMTSNHFFQTTELQQKNQVNFPLDNNLTEETSEKPLEIENWMISDEFWR